MCKIVQMNFLVFYHNYIITILHHEIITSLCSRIEPAEEIVDFN